MTNESLALLDKKLADQLKDQQAAAPRPPSALDERALLWLALVPIWTPRLATACDFPSEWAGSSERGSLRRLERLYRDLADDDRAGKAAIRHAEGLVEFRQGRLDRAESLLREALAGHEQVGSHSAIVAAQFLLGEVTSASAAGDPASWFEQALAEEITWGDAVGRLFLTSCLDLLRAGAIAAPAAGPLTGPIRGEFLESARILDRFAASGLCETVVGEAADSQVGQRLTERRYWMTDLVRQQVIKQVTDDPAQGMAAIQRELAVIGKRTLDAADHGLPVLPAVLNWATLAALAPDVGAMARRLASECDRLLSPGAVDDPNPSGTVLAWIRAAAPLEQLLKGELTMTLDRAGRRLDLFHRRLDDDQRHLTHFVARADQMAAINDLLTDEDAWALHFVGAGGAGKTMLMRYITSHLGPRLGASTARIDFDYLNPDYPAQRPGLLLAELAEELRLSGEGEALSLFAQFDEQLLLLHEQRTGASKGVAGAGTGGISIEKVRATFASALAALPPPVILLIDTCEELAKVRQDGTSPEGVKRTFEILNELRASVAGLKVIFAGRRPLARSGAGWEMRGESELPDRPDLRLHEIRGFSEPEALGYLESEGVAEPLRSPILTQARDLTEAERFTWTDPTRAPAKIARFSPFELSGWAALARQRTGETLTPADIVAADADRYIELRVIRRIRYDPLVRALPALGLLGRFDAALLRTVTAPSSDFDAMFTELRQQEWIHGRSIDVYEVDEALRRRLLAHYERVSAREVERCYRLAAEHLEQRTLNDSLADLLPFHFDTAMRVLRREPGRAARWWAKAEERFAAEGEYEWARQLAEFMLGPEGVCPELDRFGYRPAEVTALRAGVLATQLACFTHSGQHADRGGGWADVAALLDDYPDESAGRALAYRAKVGQLATLSQGPLVRIIGELSQPLDAPPPGEDQLAASFVAAVERCVELAEEIYALQAGTGGVKHSEPAIVPDLPSYIDNGDWPSELVAFFGSLTGRLAVLGGSYTKAEEDFRRSLTVIRESDAEASGDRASRWLDWRPPENLSARLRLESIRGLYPAVLGAKAVLQLTAPDLTDWPATIDEERLASAELMLHGARKRPDSPWLDSRPKALVELASRLRPERNCHRAFPALAISVAETMAAVGQVDQALGLLGAIGRTSERTGSELDSVIDATRAELRIVRRMRLRDEGRGPGGDLAGSVNLADRELLWSLDGLDGAKAAGTRGQRIDLGVRPTGANELALAHARWRTLSPLAWSRQAISEFAASLGPEANHSGGLDSWTAILDRVEAGLLISPAEILVATPQQFPDWWQIHPDRPEQALRLLLRAAALNPQGPRRANIPASLIDRLGRRRAALIALDEGEMLGLRLPDRSLPLVDLARDWLFGRHDYVGAFIARTLYAVLQARTGTRPSTGYFDEAATDIRLLSFLPPWTELKEIVQSPTDAALDALVPRDWRPWLIRFLSCYSWSRPQRNRPANLRLMQNWIELHFGELQRDSPDSSAVAVPAELEGWLGGFAPQMVSRDYWRSLDLFSRIGVGLRQARELRRQEQPYLRAAVFGMLTPIVMLVYIVAVAPVVLASIPIVTGSPPILIIAAYFAGYFVSVPSAAMFMLIARRRGRNYSTKLSTSSARRGILGTVSVLANLATDIADTEIRLESSDGRSLEAEHIHAPSVEESYRGSLPASLVSSLVSLQNRRRGLNVIELQLEPGFAAPCWEAMIAGSGRGLRVVRTLTSRRLRPVKSWRDLRSAVSVVADQRQDTLASLAWRRLSKRRRYRHEVWHPEDVFTPDRSAEAIDIVHLVATPINTAAGPRLDLSRVTGDQHRSRRGGTARGELMQAADVISRFPDVVCCVLQATPQEHTLRTDAERAQAATLRVIAEEVFSRGIPAVITIPVLPSETAADVLDQVSEVVVSRSTRMIPALTRAVYNAQLQVAKVADISPEVAMDICVYAGAGK